MDKESILNDIFANDPLDLLEIKAKPSPAQNEDQRLVASFEEINEFIDTHHREPQRDMSDMQEIKLHSRLKGLREHSEKMEALQKHDRHKLFVAEGEVELNSLDDILNGDAFGVLDDAEDIFTLKHIPEQPGIKADPDFVAQREPCKDFEKYEHLFKACHSDLKSQKRRLVPSIESKLYVGTFCVLDGVLLYIAKIFNPKQGNSGKVNRRTLLIFENGTQSNMLLRSLGKRLQTNGKMVTEHDDNALANLTKINNEDESTGFIYILESKSKNDKIKSIQNLYKIGFSKIDVLERIKNAENEPTYLMAPVTLVSAFECYNMNPHKLEQLLHQFFGKACLNIDIFDKDGERHIPREWFIAPLEIIEQVIALILTGDIVHYRYDLESEQIIGK